MGDACRVVPPRMDPSFRCQCEFHTRTGRRELPVPVLFRIDEENSFWIWLMSLRPVRIVVVLRDASGRPYPRQFRGFVEACGFVCRFYNLPVDRARLRDISAAGVVRTSADAPPQPVAAAGLVQEGFPLLPDDFGQSAVCHGWKRTAHHLMPSVSRKHPRRAAPLPPPPRSPLRGSAAVHADGERDARAYEAEALGGRTEEVRRIVASFPRWNAEVVHELLFWGATPKLVEVHHTYRDRTTAQAVCTFAQPDGRLVRDVVVPIGVLRLDYPTLTENLATSRARA